MEFNEKVRLVADGLKPDGKFTDFEIMQLCRQLRGAKYSLDIAEQKLSAMGGQKPVAYVESVDRLGYPDRLGYQDRINGVHADRKFSIGDHIYAKPVPADKPAAAVPIGYASPSALKVFLMGNAEGLVIHKSKTDEHCVPIFDAPSHSQQSAEVVDVLFSPVARLNIGDKLYSCCSIHESEQGYNPKTFGAIPDQQTEGE